MPGPAPQRLQALLATGRVANVPTVISSVLVAVALTHPQGDLFGPDGLGAAGLTGLLLALLAGVLFYVGGCFLGDAVDARYDTQHRPDRPIPQGVLSAPGIFVSAFLLLGLAWLIGCLLLGGVTLPQVLTSTLLAGAIIAYAQLHKRLGPWAPVLMAGCRFLLVIWAGGALGPLPLKELLNTPLLPYGVAVFLYVLLLSIVARHESRPNPILPSLPLRLLFLLPPVLLAGLAAGHPDPMRLGLLALAALTFLGWSILGLRVLKHSVPTFVSRALAGLCLVDACFAALAGWQLTVLCLGLFLLALLLQRFAPAT